MERVPRFVIWSIEHDAWWAANARGYVRDVRDAGIYDDADSKLIVETANRITVQECRIPVQCVRWWAQ